MRLGKLTDYATVLLAEMARTPATRRSAVELSERTRVATPTVGKLLRQLAHAGLVQATRGANGGYLLARAPAQISVAEVIAALEGPIALTSCSVHGDSCPIDDHCGVRGNWWRINEAVRNALASVSLADLCAPADTLEIPLRRLDSLPTRVTAGA